jgi:hypothetical protein
MTQPIDLDGPPACIVCGTPMTVTEWPGEADDGAPMFSAVCSADSEGAHGEIVDRMERPTWRTEPGCAALVAEIERLRAEVANGPAAKARKTIPGLTLTDADVVRRAVEQAGRLEYPMRRVSAVDAALSCGEGVAAALCRACGLDPDEMVGNDGEGEE